MGSMNFSFHPLAKRYHTWKFDWEKDYVANSDGNIFRNTFRDIEEAATTLAPHAIKFEYECYDVGHRYNLKFCTDIGGADIDNLVFMKKTADKLFGEGYRWSVLAAGAAQIPMATVASQMGGNVRVGLEDSLFISRGKLAQSNAQQVQKIRRIVEDLGAEVASPDEARELLGLKGGDRVKF